MGLRNILKRILNPHSKELENAYQELLFENNALKHKISIYEDSLSKINKTLIIPAAEFVPAIGDVFKIIDYTRREIEEL